MTLRRLLVVLSVWAGALCLASLLIFLRVRLARGGPPRGPYIVSVWQGGARVARVVAPTEAAAEHALEAEAAAPGAQRIIESIVDSSPISAAMRGLLALSLAPGKDGLSVSWGGRTAYATPDDLRKLAAYEPPVQVGAASLVLGVAVEPVLAALSPELHVSPEELLRHGSFRRFSTVSDSPYPRTVAPADVTAKVLERAVRDAARYLVKNQHPDGSFRYAIDAVTGSEDPGNNYPRHAGATYFLARTADQLRDRQALRAARRAGAFMKDHATLRCGAHDCIGEGEQVDVGAAALALLGYVELVDGGAEEFRAPALELAGFLRAQQRSDGDFQHLYSVKEQHPIDVQLEYYTGEAAFALARVHRVSGDVRDLEAARRALSFLVHRSPLFLGARYFWGAEHWTCQVLEDLWQRAPDREALDFCLAWQAANRRMQFDSPPAPAEYDGAISRGPFQVPRLTPLASRLEAAVATLSVARSAGVSAAELALLETEIRRGFAFLLRYQFTQGPTHLMPDARAVAGGFPGSSIDLQVRIDYPQHAGGAMLRYWESVRR